MRHFIKFDLLNTGYLLLILLFSISCANLKQGSNIKQVNYITSYHPVVQEAEMQVVAQNFSEALKLYKQAFAEVPEPFAIDIYNAAVCAMLADDQKQAFDYLERLALKGVDLDYLVKQEAFMPLQETKKWYKFEKSYAKNRSKFRERADLDLRADLDELYARDQYFRQAKGGLRVYGDTIRKIEDKNVEFLLSVIEKHGYPGENLIGVADTLEQLPRFSIVIQRQTKPKKGYNFEPVLKDAVQNGRMRPQAAAYLIEQQGQGVYKSKAFVTVNCNKPENCEGADLAGKYFVDNLNSNQIEQINNNRAALGLESLADYRKKIVYNEQDKRFKLSNYWSVASYIVPSKEAASVLTEKLREEDLNKDPAQD
jgi:hypothetical protein